TLTWTGGALLVCLLLATVERFGFRVATSYRLFLHPSNLAMRAFGYPHILVALLFMVTSRRMQNRRSWYWFVGLLAAAGAMAYAFSRLGGGANPLVHVLTFLYFVVHDFRDLVWFYKGSGDSPHVARRADARLLLGMQALILGLLGAVLLP